MASTSGSCQGMGPSPSTARRDVDATSDATVSGVSGMEIPLDRLEESDSSSSRDVDVHAISFSPASSRSEEYRQLFHLPPDEVLLQDFNCASQESFLIQGHMYLFVHYICFYSNIFGFETKKIIAFQEVTCVRKAKTAAIFPNAIEIVTGAKKHFFASFLSRDEAYRLIIDGWSQHSSIAKAFLDPQEPKPNTCSADNDILLFHEDSKQLTDDLDVLGRTKDTGSSEVSNGVPHSEDDGAMNIEVSRAMESRNDDELTAFSGKGPLTWQLVDTDAPSIPECYILVAEATFLISVEEFFNLFFSDNASCFIEDFHSSCGDKDFHCTRWHEDDQFTFSRALSFRHPVKIGLGASYGHCQEQQIYQVYKGSHLVVETSQQITEVPYSDYFLVKGFWDIQQGSDDSNCCILRVYVNVAFAKKTMWKGKIEQSTLDECRTTHARWIVQAHGLLKQRADDGGVKDGTRDGMSSTLNNNNDEMKSLTELLRLDGGSYQSRTQTQILHGSSQGHSLLRSNLLEDCHNAFSTLVSSFSQIWATSLVYMKTQMNFGFTLIIVLLLILCVMQLIVIFLLLYSPKLRLIPDEAKMKSVDSRGGEVAWLERRLHRIKEEMAMVEEWLVKLHHEYKLVESHMHALEKVKL